MSPELLKGLAEHAHSFPHGSDNFTYRTKILYVLHSMGFFSGVLAPPLAALSMTNSRWFPFGIALALYLLQSGLISTAPETARGISSQFGLHDSLEPLETDHGRRSSPSAPSRTEDSNTSSRKYAVCGTVSIKALRTLKANMGKLLEIPNVLICLLLFFCKNAAFQSESLVYQYASERFDLKLQSTPWFKAILCVGALLATALILPCTTVSLRRLGARPRSIELGVVRGSFTLMSIMFFVVWATPDWLLLGIGMFSSITELLSTWSDEPSIIWMRIRGGSRVCSSRIYDILPRSFSICSDVRHHWTRGYCSKTQLWTNNGGTVQYWKRSAWKTYRIMLPRLISEYLVGLAST